jgi:hypothetical protein
MLCRLDVADHPCWSPFFFVIAPIEREGEDHIAIIIKVVAVRKTQGQVNGKLEIEY